MVSPSRRAERATAEAEYVDVFSSGAEEGYSPMTTEVYHSMDASSRRPRLGDPIYQWEPWTVASAFTAMIDGLEKDCFKSTPFTNWNDPLA
jgi:hypothetical protein